MAIAPITSSNPEYGFLGQAWTFWPVISPENTMNIVSGVRVISHQIISLCMVLRGEDPIHPDRGVGVRLFKPTSSPEVEYFIYNLSEEIMKWVGGIESLNVTSRLDSLSGGRVMIDIQFVPRAYSDVNTLTFGYYSYIGAAANGDFNDFLSEITLNGESFPRF